LTSKKPHLLISNDDGIDAPGIIALAEIFVRDYRVTVVAPMVEQSGKSHAFTYREGVTFCKVSFPVEGIDAYAVDGTPADCVKVALGHILAEMPDYVISGINCGHNAGIAVFYSGTVAAAREGAFWRIPSAAFSTSFETRTLEEMQRYAEESLLIFNQLRESDLLLPRMNHFYSVNFPGVPAHECRGVRAAQQSLAYYSDHYVESSENDGMVSLTFNGEMIEIEDGENHDVPANMANFVTITPISIDSTAWDVMEKLKTIEIMSLNIKELQ